MYLKEASAVDNTRYQHSKPIFNEKAISFMRKEKNGFVSCHSNIVPQLREILINPTALKILDFCDGKKTTNEVMEEILLFFNNADKEQVVKDLKNVLFDYSRFGLLNWGEMGNPFMQTKIRTLKDGYTLSLAEEGNLQQLKDFFKKESVIADTSILEYLNPVRDVKEYTDELSYRSKLFTYAEEFFLLKNPSGRLEGVVSVFLPTQKNSTTSVLGVIKINARFFDEIISMIKETLQDIAVKNITKIKYQSIMNNKNHEEISRKLTKLNFTKEGLLINEIDEKSLEIFSYIY
ncbi:hypothetical protein L8C07_08405 [Paenibacillus sp. CMAA1739]|uniref:hypothetical protein n=1 Tax=Paenibacillus ottowii TaxID=2315729 RepID=UPI002731EA34|nr:MULTISPECIES: hypothetical protein [Paenibacillus]MDP1510552.1 hypothetical protein [Paenibacillus ottowii]MEC4565966.1 hypothetical protein [Paenibacillus sp. CMAA1739]